jgi:hypothetical protein
MSSKTINEERRLGVDASIESQFIESLGEIDRIALNVAKTTLGSLFTLSKSTAFIEWLSKRGGTCSLQ